MYQHPVTFPLLNNFVVVADHLHSSCWKCTIWAYQACQRLVEISWYVEIDVLSLFFWVFIVLIYVKHHVNYIPWRIHVCHIWIHIYHQQKPQMLASIYHTTGSYGHVNSVLTLGFSSVENHMQSHWIKVRESHLRCCMNGGTLHRYYDMLYIYITL